LAYFTQAQSGSTLFLGQPNAGVGSVAAVFPAVPPETAYEIPDVLGTTPTGSTLNASIVFLQQPIGNDPAAQSAFVAQVAAAIKKYPSAQRILAWSASPAFDNPIVATLSAGGRMTSALTFFNDATSQFTLTIPGQQQLQATDTAIELAWTQLQPIFTGLGATAYSPLTIPFEGPNAFCVAFTMSMPQTALDSQNLGFAFAIPPPAPAPANAPELLLYAPLATPDVNQTPIFSATFDPLDLLNAHNPDRTVLAFTGRNLQQQQNPTTTFTSCYTSPSGTPVTLAPVGSNSALPGDVAATLVFAYPQYRNNTPAIFMLVPRGDFVLSVPGETATQYFMCGLQGMEYFAFTPAAGKALGDRLRFVANAPAYAPLFPFPLASPTAAPFDPTASPLTSVWTTAYATLRAPSTGEPTPARIVAQPPGFQLFGVGGTVDPAAHPKLLGSVAPGTQIVANPSHPFPLVPYQRVAPSSRSTMTPAQIAAFEAGILSPMRSAALAQDALAPSGPSSTAWFVTPSGYLVETQYNALAGTATWSKILLGTIGNQEIAFDDPDPALVAAFNTGSLMLVIANAKNTGTFENTLRIGDWVMEANVARPDTFGDYANIVIVKGVPGALTELVANPANWTNAATFAAPVTGQNTSPDVSQLVNVAQWLQTYLAQAAAVTGPDASYFAEFNTIVHDPDWTGVLILRADITAIPQDIIGILAGIKDFTQFNVHHLAIPVVPASVPPAPQQSPVSGLIYYNPYPGDPTLAVPTDPLVTYGFQLNSLKVTFQNSVVQTFSSYAQITLRSMLGSVSTNSGYDSVVLTGTYQLIGGQPVYSMGSTTETTFDLACAVLPNIDVTGVQMSTVSADPKGNTVSAFAITGYLDFAIVPGEVAKNGDGTIDVVDLFSFGSSTAGEPAGLAFQNLVLTMTFPTPGVDPTSPVVAAFSLASDALRFDLGTSTIRRKGSVVTFGGTTAAHYGSLVDELSLQLTGLVRSASTPAKLGYLPVIGMIPGGRLGESWNALAFDVDLGTPGQLAAKAGLTASLLLAWNPTSDKPGTWDAQIGLQLPGTSQGAPLISLQTVLSLSIGQVSLQYALTADGKDKAFLLMLDEIALAFLGLLKFPPNGATSFYLFGHPPSTQQQTALGWYARYVNAGEKA
jgi:hypothetical protein